MTSPNGTTQAGLEVLMDPNAGLPRLIGGTVAAATMRSKELSMADITYDDFLNVDIVWAQ